MALNTEWTKRIALWEKALWAACYRPLESVNLEGFATQEQLTLEQAAQCAFVPMPPETPWGAKWEYGWFRASLVVPPEAAGQRLVARLNTGGQESVVWINGRAAASIGWGHPEVPLTREARAGDRYDILFESYAGHGHITVGDGPYAHGVESVPEPGPTQAAVAQSTFGIWREEIYQAAIEFSLLLELSQRLDPLSLRAAEVDEALMQATLLIDPELPEPDLLASVAAGRQSMRPVLERRNGPTMPTLYAFGHAHMDVAWLWPLQHTERKMAMTVLNQLQLFDEYPEHRFLQSQPHLVWMLHQRYPEIYERFKAAVASGQVIADGGMWIEADTNITGGEGLIRQILYGRRFFSDEFGVDSRVLWLPDVFGYSGALPQILKGCGMVGFATQKITWAYNGGEAFPYNTFNWEGIDGSSIPAHIFTDYNSQVRPNNILDRWNKRLQMNGVNAMMFPFGWGDGGGGPTRDHLEFFRRVQDLEGLPRMKMASPAAFFADLAQSGPPAARYVGELYFQAHRGTYTSQARTKRGNRKTEFALREAELWGCAARGLQGYAFTRDTLWPAWRNVLLNHFHDILPGSSIQRVHEETESLYAETLDAVNQVTRAAAAAVAGPGQARMAFNSLSWPRRALVETGAGLAEVEAPACGWAAVPAAVASPPGPGASAVVSPGGCSLENDRIAARFGPQGELVSLWDKETDRELLAGPGNRLALFKDVPTRWDAWDIDSMAENQPVATDEPAEFELLNAGPLVASVRLRRRLNNSTVEQVVSLRRASRRLDFDTIVDWQESHKLLKVCFPVDIHSREVISEIQFGHLRRPNHQSRQYDADRFEICNQKWSALAEEGRGVAVLNDCKYGLSARDNSLNLTLLKSPLAPDMNADKGVQRFTYALYSWNGSLLDSGVVREAYDLNVPVLVLDGVGPRPAQSLFSLDAANVVIEAVKPAEDGSNDIVLRLYEAMRTATRCLLSTSLPVTAALQTNMLEEETAPLPCSAGQITLDFRPFEIKTVRLRLPTA